MVSIDSPGGFGNLIALPLQAIPSQSGNSLFIDKNFKPYPDQWTFLRSVNKLPSPLTNRINRLAAFQNPSFYHAQALRLSAFGKPRILSCTEEFDKYVAVPRGCIEELLDLFQNLNIRVEIDDRRFPGIPKMKKTRYLSSFFFDVYTCLND